MQQLLRSAHQDVMEAIDGIAELEIRQVPVPDERTVAQLMAHIAEIQYFWMEKAVLITQEDDPNITRSDVENDRHAAAVEDHAGDSLAELIRVGRSERIGLRCHRSNRTGRFGHPWPPEREQSNHR